MAITKRVSRKCPICVACTPDKVEKVNAALQSVLAQVKASGELPKGTDHRLQNISFELELSPYSLRYHLKDCLLTVEIQDQLLLELTDMADAVATAKDEYSRNPCVDNASALTSLVTSLRALAKDLQGTQDPDAAVEFITTAVISPITRGLLISLAKEARDLRDSLVGLLPKNHALMADNQIKGLLTRVSSSISELTDEGLDNLCEFYKVELESQRRKNAVAAASTLPVDVVEDTRKVH